jgi:hypothetical protein
VVLLIGVGIIWVTIFIQPADHANADGVDIVSANVGSAPGVWATLLDRTVEAYHPVVTDHCPTALLVHAADVLCVDPPTYFGGGAVDNYGMNVI